MNKNTNWIKNLIMAIIFVSIITQVNIAINDGVKSAVTKYKENKKQEKVLPDISENKETENFDMIEIPQLPLI